MGSSSLKVLLVQAGAGPRHPAGLRATKQPPLGLCYIASYLLAAGHEVRGVDLFLVDDDDDLERELLSWQPDVLGLSFVTEMYNHARRIIATCRRLAPRCRIVCGGAHVTFQIDEVMAALKPDAIVPMDGELIMRDLVAAVAEDRDLGEVKGAKTKDNELSCGPYVEKLDEILFPAREVFAWDKYGKLWHEHLARLGASDGSTPPFTIVGHRGCPMNCKFCVASAMRDRQRVRARGVENTIAEIAYASERYGTNAFMLIDELFVQSRKKAVDFCAQLGKLGRRFRWTCEARVDRLDEELMRTLVEAGCFRCQVGFEAADNESLQSIGKQTTVEQILAVASTARKVGLHLVGNLIVGLPEEQERHMKGKFELLKKLIDVGVSPGVSFLTPYPGTEYYERRDEHGIVIESDNWEDYNFDGCIISNRHMSRDDLTEYGIALRGFIVDRMRLSSLSHNLPRLWPDHP